MRTTKTFDWDNDRNETVMRCIAGASSLWPHPSSEMRARRAGAFGWNANLVSLLPAARVQCFVMCATSLFHPFDDAWASRRLLFYVSAYSTAFVSSIGIRDRLQPCSASSLNRKMFSTTSFVPLVHRRRLNKSTGPFHPP